MDGSVEALSDSLKIGRVCLIDKVVYGIPSVAEKRFKRDVAKAVYEANQESINTQKLQIRIIDNQIQREWK